MKFDLKQIIQHYNNLNEQARYGILAAVVFLVILLDIFCLTLPQLGGIVRVNAQIKKISDNTQQVLTDKGRISLLRKNLEDQRRHFKILSSKVLSIQEAPIILNMVSSIADEYGVKIDQLVPEKSQQEVLTKFPEGKYYALPVVIKARCGYHQFGRFLNKLERDSVDFIMKDFVIQNDDKDPNSHLFSMTIKIILVERNSAPI